MEMGVECMYNRKCGSNTANWRDAMLINISGINYYN